MTKVQIHYELARPLGDGDLQALSDVHSHYGIMRVKLGPTPERITVDYDASRMMESDVESVLARFGIPIRRDISAVA